MPWAVRHGISEGQDEDVRRTDKGTLIGGDFQQIIDRIYVLSEPEVAEGKRVWAEVWWMP